MADNYLERKMDDLRSGRLQNSNKATVTSAPVAKKGYIQVAFPARRVLVTGGANGIGLAVTRSYLKAGCKVAVFDIDSEKGEKLAHDEGIRFYNTDVSDCQALEKALYNLLEAWKDIDIVVSNAGIFQCSTLEESETTFFDQIINTNLRPAYIMARIWAAHRRRFPIPNSFGGRMITISSTRHIQSEKGTEAYSASKGGVASLTHALMQSLSEFGITVNCISPGWIHTGNPEDLSQTDKLQHPSRRVGTPEDIARLCLFLSLPGNDFINGADIPVDGGMTRKMIYDS